MTLWFNLLCRDVETQMAFYARLLGWPEAVHSRSPIYRALENDGVQFGFNAAPAYALLGLADRTPDAATTPPVTAYATFMLDTPDAVDAAVCEAARDVFTLGPHVRATQVLREARKVLERARPEGERIAGEFGEFHGVSSGRSSGTDAVEP